jgi:endo-1,4-beta-D-glucanase Y
VRRLHRKPLKYRAALTFSAVSWLAFAAGCTHPDQGETDPSTTSGSAGSGSGSGSSVTGNSTGSSGTGGTTGASATGATGGTTGAGSGGSSGSSTGSASGTSSGKDAAVLTRGPTPSTSTTKFPFPQNRQANNCIFPTAYDNDDVQAAYQQWKTDLVVSAGSNGEYRIQRTSTDGVDKCRPANSTVSEGIGYGMLIAVYMDDQSLFDGLWLYEQENLDMNGLMNWAPGGPQDATDGCTGGATDADEDMAFALAMADQQWGGQGSLSKSYKQIAITQITNIWNSEIFQFKYVRAGDGTWATNANLNPSYFAPAYYRVFANLDPNNGAQPKDDWMGTIDQVYATINDSLNNGNASNGLVPAWCNDSNAGNCTPGPGGQPGNYQYDSCRIPFRIGLDWCWFGETRAQTYLGKISSFFSGVGAANIVDGYGLDGTPQPANMNSAGQSAAFIGPAGVGAMSAATYQSFVNDAYGLVATDELRIGGAYYEESWTVMSLLMMSANFLNYASITSP